VKPIDTLIKSTTVMLQTFNKGFIHEIRQTKGVKTKVHKKKIVKRTLIKYNYHY